MTDAKNIVNPQGDDRSADADGSAQESGQALAPLTTPPIEQKLEGILKDLPPTKQQQIKQTVHEEFMAVVQGGINPKIDPEVARILTDSLDKDNENKFRYLTQKQSDEAARDERAQGFEKLKFETRVKFLWPIVTSILLITIAGLVEGVYLATHGHETLGVNILTAIITAVFAYLAGLGTANFFKDD